MLPRFAIGIWIFFAVPLMVILPVVMILLGRLVGGWLGDDSFRLRPSGEIKPAAKLVGELSDDAL